MRTYLGLIVLILILLKIGDFALVRTLPNAASDSDGNGRFFAFDYFPYTGYHVPGNRTFGRTGGFPLLDRDGVNVRTGDYGFLIDFPLAHPPEKKPGEFRLILIGGSIAQGWGADTNDGMFYKVLERDVNAKLKGAGSKKTLRVINLAMASANTYQNFIALNLWARRMNPDAIISVSGLVDFDCDSTMFEGGYSFGGFVYTQRPASAPSVVRALAAVYPGIFRYSIVGQALRSVGLARETDRFRSDYRQRELIKDRFEASVGFYAGALQSITRDFPKSPLVVVTQPFDGATEVMRFYAASFEFLKKEIEKGQVRVVNAHDHWEANGRFPGSFADDRHFTEKGHQLLSDFVSGPVMKLIEAKR